MNRHGKIIITDITNEDDFNFVVKHFGLKVLHQKWNMVFDTIVVQNSCWFGINHIHILYNRYYNNFEIVNINKLK